MNAPVSGWRRTGHPALTRSGRCRIPARLIPARLTRSRLIPSRLPRLHRNRVSRIRLACPRRMAEQVSKPISGVGADQRDVPQPRNRPANAFQQPDPAAGLAEQPAGSDNRGGSQRQLDEHGGQEAVDEIVSVSVENHVKPGIAAQQGRQHDQADNQQLPAPPRRPASDRECHQQREVKAHPGTAPVTGPVVARQGQREYRDPHGQAGAAGDGDRKPDCSRPATPWRRSRLGILEPDERAQQITSFARAQAAEPVLGDHAITSPAISLPGPAGIPARRQLGIC